MKKNNLYLIRRSLLTATIATTGATLAMNFISTAKAADVTPTNSSVNSYIAALVDKLLGKGYSEEVAVSSLAGTCTG